MEGKAFAGQLVIGTEPSDADFMKGKAIMHVWKVSESEIRIPFHIGENRSRTWVLTKTDNGLRLKHDHRKPDGVVLNRSQHFSAHHPQPNGM